MQKRNEFYFPVNKIAGHELKSTKDKSKTYANRLFFVYFVYFYKFEKIYVCRLQ